MRTVFLGLGNTILSDDGAGIFVLRRLRPQLEKAGIPCLEASVGGFSFIDLLTGYDRAVLIDAIQTQDALPGTFYELDLTALIPTARISGLHQIDLATAAELARDMKIPFPKELRIFVMEVEDPFRFGETPSPRVAEAIGPMAASIVETLRMDGWIEA